MDTFLAILKMTPFRRQTLAICYTRIYFSSLKKANQNIFTPITGSLWANKNLFVLITEVIKVKKKWLYNESYG
jgi:hypothetical protein